MSARRSAGFTLIETLVVIAVLGVLLAIAIPQLRPPAARVAADAVHSFMQQMRFEAIKLNRPVVVALEADGASLVGSRLSNSSHLSCTAGSGTVRSLSLEEYRNVTVSAFDGPFVWLPNGRPVGCSGQPLSGPVGLQLTDGRRDAAVEVSPAGAVGLP